MALENILVVVVKNTYLIKCLSDPDCPDPRPSVVNFIKCVSISMIDVWLSNESFSLQKTRNVSFIIASQPISHSLSAKPSFFVFLELILDILSKPFYFLGQLHSQSLERNLILTSTPEASPKYDDSYMGYSVATGDFAGQGMQGVAVGVPRGQDLRGLVSSVHTSYLGKILSRVSTRLFNYTGELC